MKTFNIKLVFDDLRRNGISIRGTEEYIEATGLGVHSGSMFDGTITFVDEDDEYDFEAMLDNGLQVVFWVTR